MAVWNFGSIEAEEKRTAKIGGREWLVGAGGHLTWGLEGWAVVLFVGSAEWLGCWVGRGLCWGESGGALGGVGFQE